MSSLTEKLFGNSGGTTAKAAPSPDTSAPSPLGVSFDPVKKAHVELFAVAPQVAKASRRDRQRARMEMLNGKTDISAAETKLIEQDKKNSGKQHSGKGKGEGENESANPDLWKTVVLFKAPNPTDDLEGDGKSKKKNVKPKKLLRHGLERNEKEDERTVFVGNLPNTATRKMVEKYFKDCGAIESVRIRNQVLAEAEDREKATKRGRAIRVLRGEIQKGDEFSATAYVLFTEESSVDKAVKKSGLVADGRHLVVTKLDVESAAYPPETSVFLGNLAYTTTEEMVWNFFVEYGVPDVKRVRLVRDKETGKCKGFGYVEFMSPRSVEPGIATRGNELNGREVRIVHVQKSKDVKVAQQTRREKRKRDNNNNAYSADGDDNSKNKKKGGKERPNSDPSTMSKKEKEDAARPAWMGIVTNARRKMPRELRHLVDGGRKDKKKSMGN